jgi:hypothetical protein
MAYRTPLVRTLRLLALLIQLGLPSLGVVADARLELASVGEPMHVESEGHECHSRGHASDCALCQYLRGAPLAEPSREGPLSVAVASLIVPAEAPPARAGQRLALPARGPPLFS